MRFTSLQLLAVALSAMLVSGVVGEAGHGGHRERGYGGEQLAKPAHQQIGTPQREHLAKAPHGQIGTPAGEHLAKPAHNQIGTPAGKHLAKPAHDQIGTPSGVHLSEQPKQKIGTPAGVHLASSPHHYIGTPSNASSPAPQARSRHHAKSSRHSSATTTNGKVTFYFGGQLLNPACPGARTPTDSSMTAAISNASPFSCGDRIRISDKHGKSVVVTAVDRCAGCTEDWIDVTKGVFRIFDGLDTGVLHEMTFSKM